MLQCELSDMTAMQ